MNTSVGLFDGPEHVPYLKLRREMRPRLDREFRQGDWCCHSSSAGYGATLVYPEDITIWDRVQTLRGPDRASDEYVWVPRLDQWLNMLEAAGVIGVAFQRLADAYYNFNRAGDPIRSTAISSPSDLPRYACFDCEPERKPMAPHPCGSSREEAAEYLWREATGFVQGGSHRFRVAQSVYVFVPSGISNPEERHHFESSLIYEIRAVKATYQYRLNFAGVDMWFPETWLRSEPIQGGSE